MQLLVPSGSRDGQRSAAISRASFLMLIICLSAFACNRVHATRLDKTASPPVFLFSYENSIPPWIRRGGQLLVLRTRDSDGSHPLEIKYETRQTSVPRDETRLEGKRETKKVGGKFSLRNNNFIHEERFSRARFPPQAAQLPVISSPSLNYAF